MKRSAIVTGAASGIGKSIAEALSQEGYDVIVADQDEINGRSVSKAIGGVFIRVDLTDRESCRHLIEAAVEELGGIDILVNNAGFQYVKPLEDFPEDKWEEMLRVMLTAPFLLTKYAWPHMKKRNWGRVVNIASIHGLVASPNKVGYTSAKHGLLGLTRTAALEGGAHGITVNALCPAYVRTSLVENQIADQAQVHDLEQDEVIEKVMLKSAAIKSIIEPDEISSLVVYLCSDRASSITGSCWTIDCGWTAQ